MADIQDNDQFLVNRSDSTATVTAATLMADLLDDDLMLVNRSDVTYTVTGADVKASLGGGGGKEIYPEIDEITITPPPQSGSGTAGDPYILQTVDVRPAGASGLTVETLTIDVAGAESGDLVVFTNNSVGSGDRFNQPTRVVELDGSWSGHLVYFDTPDSVADADYVGDLRIGDVYFRWTVEQGLDAIRPIDPDPSEITANPDFKGGTGTESDPYLLESITVAPAGGYGQSVELITIAEVGAQEGHLVRWTDNSVGADNRFAQPEGFVGADGTWTGRLVYNDIPDSPSDQIYTGDLQIGETYFRWFVDQKFAADTPPEIGSVSLVEQNPGVDPRFTDQEFVATVDMTEQGVPQSIKTIDAYVQGAITTEGQFDEPLESNASGSTNYAQYLSNPTNPGGFSGDPNDVFTGNPSTGVVTTGVADSITWDIPGQFQESGAWGATTNLTNHTYYYALTLLDNNVVDGTASSDNAGYLEIANSASYTAKKLLVRSNTSTTGLNEIYYKFRQVIDDTATQLVFASGTDMTTLAAGDAVNQEETVLAPGQDFTNGGTFQFGGQTTDLDNKQATFDGNEFDQAYGRPDLNGVGSTGTVAYVFANPIPVQTLQLGLLISSPFTQEININASANWHKVTNNFINATDLLEGATQLTSLAVRQTANATVTGPVYFFNRIIVDGNVLKDGVPITASANGTVGSITDTTVTLSSSSGVWTDGINVTGPQKTITGDNVKKYLKFDNSGNVSDLLNSPQSPAYETTSENPSLTLTFPSTFPSGNAPDDELGDGTTLTVCATAANAAGTSGPTCETVQPEVTEISYQFIEPLESSSSASGLPATTWSNLLTAPSGVNNPQNAFDGTPNRSTATGGLEVMTFTLPSAINGQIAIDTGLGGALHEIYTNNSLTSTVNALGSGIVAWDVTNATSVGVKCLEQQTGITGIYLDSAQFLDGQAMPGGGVSSTDLVFAAGTDMTNLAKDDAVVQETNAELPAQTWSNSLSGNSLGDAGYAFNGGLSSSAYCYGKMTFTIGTAIDGIITIYMPNAISIGSLHNLYVNDSLVGQKPVEPLGSERGIFYDVTGATSIGVEIASGSYTEVTGFALNGNLFVDNQPVQLADAAGIVSSISGTTVTLASSSGSWVDGLDVVGPDKTPDDIRSLTQEELDEQRLKFQTYEHRKHVECAAQAEAERDALIQSLVAQGYTLEEVLRLI